MGYGGFKAMQTVLREDLIIIPVQMLAEQNPPPVQLPPDHFLGCGGVCRGAPGIRLRIGVSMRRKDPHSKGAFIAQEGNL